MCDGARYRSRGVRSHGIVEVKFRVQTIDQVDHAERSQTGYRQGSTRGTSLARWGCHGEDKEDVQSRGEWTKVTETGQKPGPPTDARVPTIANEPSFLHFW